MLIAGLNHYTIRCSPSDLPELVEFYTQVLNLTVGERPTMPRPGFWLYSEGRAIVHLYAKLDRRDWGPTGGLDHISFVTRGLEKTRVRLRHAGKSFEELPVAGTPIHQIFLRDPTGLTVELTFDLDQERTQEQSNG
jgi:catechol 2,3-dioxygenase-like lactoylglutathione lyase family enzyme